MRDDGAVRLRCITWLEAADVNDSRLSKWGVKRFPALTLAVLGVTVITSVASIVSSPVFDAMQRTPDAVGGQWWRNASALLAQDGGLAGAAINVVFLVVIGTLAEQVISRWEWIFLYCVGGILAELVAHFWQPTGAGNSIAICAITGPIAIELFRNNSALPRFSAVIVWYWLAGLLATLWWPLLWVGIAAALGAQLVTVKNGNPNRVTALAVVVVGLVLAMFHNIHGGALIIGLVLAALIATATHRMERVGA